MKLLSVRNMAHSSIRKVLQKGSLALAYSMGQRLQALASSTSVSVTPSHANGNQALQLHAREAFQSTAKYAHKLPTTTTAITARPAQLKMAVMVEALRDSERRRQHAIGIASLGTCNVAWGEDPVLATAIRRRRGGK